jgi:hypothetical protein
MSRSPSKEKFWSTGELKSDAGNRSAGSRSDCYDGCSCPSCLRNLLRVSYFCLSVSIFRLLALVEHFEFFSGNIGEKCPLFFTLFFTKKTSEKLKIFAALFGLFQNFHLKNEKVVKIL